jgi:putative sigma-54 modulation protein
MKFEMTGRNVEIDEKMRDYIEDKIGGLEKYVPKHMRESANCAIVIEDDANGREDNRYVCEAVLSINGTQMVSREGTVNIYAAVDIVEAKLRPQLMTFKEKSTLEPRRGRRLSEWLGRRKPAQEAPDIPEL